ncbi:hypothetical protein BBP00_00000697 [Phytophthora kernoviae]|uniref:Histone-lysine N-methyltransferase n=1 Tax=Phytophthora kernoviae TaxID=325452 RepID=A0A3F2S2D5_9STRA|nr:hypothetical protein BBP00_00000697 [Phytophthora kernoviae]
MEGGSRIAVDQQEQAKAVVTTVVKRHDHVDVRLVGANVDAEAGEATAASVAPPDTNDPVGDTTVSNKRTHEEGEDEVMLEKSRQCKRVARGDDESVAPSSAAQTSDETVGDSSEDVEMSEPLDEEEAIRNSAAHASEEEKRAHEEFCSQLTEKQQVDVFDVRTRQWLAAKIDHIDNDSYTVHYMGWNSKCDERIEKIKNYRLMPRATKAVKAWVKHRAKINKNRRAKQEKLAAPPTPPLEDHLVKEIQASELAPTFVQTGLTRSGRAITQRISNGSLKKPAKSVGKKSLTAVESKFPEEDLCGICGEIEDDNLTDMIMCDGGCLKSHHFSCLGIESAPDDEQWLCEQCRTNEQLCFACGRNGTINEKGGVFRCSVASCGKFFHQACIDANKMSRRAAPTPGMKFNKHNRESNCTLGENCGNRALHQKVYPRFQKFHTVEKGWGLRVLESVKAGQLVIEYVGEVINEDEKERRLLEHAKKSPEDKNMYIMELGKGEYIDARFKGSVSRFINHSCDPNCHLLKWRVKGVNRIAITALKDIESGTELSYDYQFHTKQAMEWKCHCKAKNCRGTMAPEKINQPNDSPVKKLTKKEKLKQRKRALIQEKIQNEKEAKSTARRLSLTANVSTGDRTTADKMAARSGPATRELQWAKYYRLFHMRDAKCGFNFKLRKELRDQRIGALERVKREELSVSGSTTAASSRSVSPVRLIELAEAKNDPVGKGTEKGATEASAIKEDPVIK